MSGDVELGGLAGGLASGKEAPVGKDSPLKAQMAEALSRPTTGTEIALTIKTLDARQYELKALPDVRVATLKQELSQQTNTPADSQRLLSKGHEMHDDKPLSYYCQDHKQILYMVVRFPGASMSEEEESADGFDDSASVDCVVGPPSGASLLQYNSQSGAQGMSASIGSHYGADDRNQRYRPVHSRHSVPPSAQYAVASSSTAASAAATSASADGANRQTPSRIMIRGTITIPVPEGDVHRVVSSILGGNSPDLGSLMESMATAVSRGGTSSTPWPIRIRRHPATQAFPRSRPELGTAPMNDGSAGAIQPAAGRPPVVRRLILNSIDGSMPTTEVPCLTPTSALASASLGPMPSAPHTVPRLGEFRHEAIDATLVSASPSPPPHAALAATLASPAAAQDGGSSSSLALSAGALPRAGGPLLPGPRSARQQHTAVAAEHLSDALEAVMLDGSSASPMPSTSYSTPPPHPSSVDISMPDTNGSVSSISSAGSTSSIGHKRKHWETYADLAPSCSSAERLPSLSTPDSHTATPCSSNVVPTPTRVSPHRYSRRARARYGSTSRSQAAAAAAAATADGTVVEPAMSASSSFDVGCGYSPEHVATSSSSGAVAELAVDAEGGMARTRLTSVQEERGADSELPATSSVAAVGADGGDDDIATADVTRSSTAADCTPTPSTSLRADPLERSPPPQAVGSPRRRSAQPQPEEVSAQPVPNTPLLSLVPSGDANASMISLPSLPGSVDGAAEHSDSLASRADTARSNNHDGISRATTSEPKLMTMAEGVDGNVGSELFVSRTSIKSPSAEADGADSVVAEPSGPPPAACTSAGASEVTVVACEKGKKGCCVVM